MSLLKYILAITCLFSASLSSAQKNPAAPANNQQIEFVELNYGIAEVVHESSEKLKNSPTGSRGYLSEFTITKVTDSIHAELKANFGVEYMIKTKDTFDIAVDIEWIFPERIKNDEGKRFKSMKYTTQRPANLPTASSYSLDKPFEMVKGEWKMNIFIYSKLVYTKTFILY